MKTEAKGKIQTEWKQDAEAKYKGHKWQIYSEKALLRKTDWGLAPSVI